MKFIRSASTTRREKRSMQYYRVWIHSCNGVLGVTSAIFAIFAAFVLADVRLSLLGGVELYHPTFLYAYVALILQCGVVQTIGCLGAQRLSHKLLSLYWILLLILTIGDVVVGLVWVYKLDKVKFNLRPILTKEFISKYSTDELFTNTWNFVQSEEHCCGVDGPLDYDKLPQVHSQHSSSSGSNNFSLTKDRKASLLSLPESCCIVIYDPPSVSRGSGFSDSFNKTYSSPDHFDEKEFSGTSYHPKDGSGGGSGGWDDRGGSDNVTNPFALGDDPLSYDNSGGGGGSGGHSGRFGSFNYEDEMSSQVMNDGPVQQERLTSSEDFTTAEDDLGGESVFLIPSWNFTEEKKSHSKKRGEVDDKHRKRHKNNSHRWKVVMPQIVLENNSSSKQSLTNLPNDTLSYPKVLPLLGEIGYGESKNRTKLKPHKTQKSLLPTISFPTQLPLPTPEPETEEHLPVPFTCQRHLKVSKSSQQQQQLENVDYESNPKQSLESSNPEFHKDSAAPAFSSLTLTATPIPPRNRTGDGVPQDLETNDSGGDLRYEKNNDESPHIFSTIPQQTLESNRRHDENQNQNRRKRRHSPVSSQFSTPSSTEGDGGDDISTLGVNPTFKPPMAGSHLFSFLHASAFPYPEGKNPHISNDGGESGGGVPNPGSAATEIQAAYYFSSSYYQGNPYNSSLAKRFQVYRNGCGMKLIQWVDHVSGILFILGFCIIGFVKICFLVILRTEIREMIEKIQILELDNPGSPSRTQLKDQRLHHVSHPLLAHPHRASTVSAHAYNATCLPTIKSPEGPCTAPNRLFSKSYQMRRHSNIIGDRSSTHSQETVNMTLLVTNNGGGGGHTPQGQCAASGGCNHPTGGEMKYEKGRSNPNLSNFLLRDQEYDPMVSISVPNTAKYLRRSSTCSATAHMGPGGYGYLPHYDGEPRPGPSSRFYHHDTQHHHLYHPQHCTHGHYARPRLYQRNMSIGAVVHHTGGGQGGSTGTSSNFRSTFGGVGGAGGGGESGGGSANCSFSSRDENDILSASMENVEVEQQPPPSDDEKEKERRDAEIRDWAASTSCTVENSEKNPNSAVTVSLGDYTKTGFNHSSDSAESNGGPGGRRNGNNNVEYDMDSIPLSYLGTAV